MDLVKTSPLFLLLILAAVMSPTTSLGQAGISVAQNINSDVRGQALNRLVNSAYRELGPLPTKDGKRLYFSRQGHPDNLGGAQDEDIWFSEFDPARQLWTEARNIGAPLNTTGPNFILGVSPSGDTVLLANVYGKGGKMSAGVSFAIRKGDSWTQPERIPVTGDYNISGRSSYNVARDRSAMIIAEEKDDSKGKLDLYVAFPSKGKTTFAATESVNLGPVINTSGDETSPWLSYDNRTLYFCSSGHKGYGGLDIFVTRRLDDTWTKWSQPENLGPGINSEFDDLSFNFNPRERHAYFSRGLAEKNTDIFAIDMTWLFKDLKNNDSIEFEPVIGRTFVINNVFKNDSTNINAATAREFMRLMAYLKKHKNVSVMITTHSNEHSSRTTSQQLSERRAQNIVDYIVASGVVSTRISQQGMGHDVVVNSKDGAGMPGSVEIKLVRFR